MTAETSPNTINKAAQVIFDQWHSAVLKRDLDALMALYADDAVIETPLAYVTSGQRDGTIRGAESIRAFFRASFAQPENGLGRWYRTGRYHSDGRQLVWEYPRATPEGDQVDLVEVVDIDRNKIASHRVYWGWRGFEALKSSLLKSH
jgi:ketosteroid isomerase-like protein